METIESIFGVGSYRREESDDSNNDNGNNCDNNGEDKGESSSRSSFLSNKNADAVTDESITQKLLDPLSVIIKLAIISNKPVGTKLLIKNNVVHIQEPGPFQGFCRYINKSTKNDLQYLYNPIQLACQYFMNEEYREENPQIVELFECAQRGVEKLLETYANEPIIQLCLNYYYTLIENYVKEIYNPLFRDDSFTVLYTDLLTHKLNDLWTPEKIKVVLDIVSFLNDDEMANDNVKSLDIFIQNMDKHTQGLLSHE